MNEIKTLSIQYRTDIKNGVVVRQGKLGHENNFAKLVSGETPFIAFHGCLSALRSKNVNKYDLAPDFLVVSIHYVSSLDFMLDNHSADENNKLSRMFDSLKNYTMKTLKIGITIPHACKRSHIPSNKPNDVG